MAKTNRSNFLRFILILGLLLGSMNVFSQPPGGPPPGGGGSTGTRPPCWTPTCVPIDGGIGFLIVAGVALGARKLYKKS